MVKKATVLFILLIFSSFTLAPTIWSHSGRTDSNGGHKDTATGTYHKHSPPDKKPMGAGSSTIIIIRLPKINSICEISNNTLKNSWYYLDRTNKKYHRPDCPELPSKRYAIIEDHAKKTGYSPCSVCVVD